MDLTRRYLQMLLALAEEAAGNKRNKSKGEEYKKQYRALAGAISHLNAAWHKEFLPEQGKAEELLRRAFGGDTANKTYASSIDATCVLALAGSEEPFGKLLDVNDRALRVIELVAEAARHMLEKSKEKETDTEEAAAPLALPKLSKPAFPYAVIEGGRA